VLIADDHALVADGIRCILEPECEIAGVCEDGRALLKLPRNRIRT
jgi:DNA-binding NarL/FixJ family response regulator